MPILIFIAISAFNIPMAYCSDSQNTFNLSEQNGLWQATKANRSQCVPNLNTLPLHVNPEPFKDISNNYPNHINFSPTQNATINDAPFPHSTYKEENGLFEAAVTNRSQCSANFNDSLKTNINSLNNTVSSNAYYKELDNYFDNIQNIFFDNEGFHGKSTLLHEIIQVSDKSIWLPNASQDIQNINSQYNIAQKYLAQHYLYALSENQHDHATFCLRMGTFMFYEANMHLGLLNENDDVSYEVMEQLYFDTYFANK